MSSLVPTDPKPCDKKKAQSMVSQVEVMKRKEEAERSVLDSYTTDIESVTDLEFIRLVSQMSICKYTHHRHIYLIVYRREGVTLV